MCMCLRVCAYVCECMYMFVHACVHACVDESSWKGHGCCVTLGSPALEIQFTVSELYCRHLKKKKNRLNNL